MQTLRLRNVRSLRDTGTLTIKPITLLLGQNSSGKSTFLRTLPLLKQSFATRSSAPVLWYGDLVDFGSASEVKSTFSGSDAIYVEIGLSSEDLIIERYGSTQASIRPDISFGNVKIGIELDEIERKTQLKSVSIRFDEDKAKFSVDVSGSISAVEVNGVDYSRFFPSDKFFLTMTDLVPQLMERTDTPAAEGAIFRLRRASAPVGREIRKFYRQFLHGNMSDGTVTKIANSIGYASGEKFLSSLKSKDIYYQSWIDFVSMMGKKYYSDELNKLRALHLLAIIPETFSSLHRTLFYDLGAVAYVGPSRATGERYYRFQELAVDKIDPSGRNLPMFLNSLSSMQLNNFSEWLTEYIGYRVTLERSTGHIQIRLKECNSENYYNIADMGYGFSQILPIMAQIWLHQTGPKPSRNKPIVAIEQPELHLHPAYQARIADALAGAIQASSQVSNNKDGLKLVVETHSETLINRLGEKIYNGELSRDDVVIYIFDKPPNEPETTVRTVEYDETGILLNWPYGFFSSSAQT